MEYIIGFNFMILRAKRGAVFSNQGPHYIPLYQDLDPLPPQSFFFFDRSMDGKFLLVLRCCPLLLVGHICLCDPL